MHKENNVKAISSPSHYTQHPSGVECIDITKHFNFCCGNVIKYIWRCGLKGGESSLKDLMKARQYIDFEIERVKDEEKDSSVSNESLKLQQGPDYSI